MCFFLINIYKAAIGADQDPVRLAPLLNPLCRWGNHLFSCKQFYSKIAVWQFSKVFFPTVLVLSNWDQGRLWGHVTSALSWEPMLTGPRTWGFNALWFGLLEFLIIFTFECVLPPVQSHLVSPLHTPLMDFQPPSSYSCPLLMWQLDCHEVGRLEAQDLGAGGQWHLGQGKAAAVHTGLAASLYAQRKLSGNLLPIPNSGAEYIPSFLAGRLQSLMGPWEMEIDLTSLS